MVLDGRKIRKSASHEHDRREDARVCAAEDVTDEVRAVREIRGPDVTRPADLIEEIARLHGYDQFPATLPHGTGGGLSPAQTRERNLRARLVGAGLTEVATLSFMSAGDLDVLIGARYPLADAADAHRALEARKTVGKILLTTG